MKTRFKIAMGAALVLALMLMLLTGCQSNGDPDTPAATPEPPPQEQQAEVPQVEDPQDEDEVETPAEFAYPMEGSHTVTIWEGLPGSLAPNFVSRGETQHSIWLEELTGINIEWLHPPAGQTAEQFNLIMASRDFPDVMITNWMVAYPGGPDRAIADGVIHRLNEIWDSYSPNVINFLHNERPDIGRAARTDTGNYFVFPFVRENAITQTFIGPYVRADWLNELGMDIPETLGDWEAMLIGFRDEYSATAPFSFIDGNRIWNPVAVAHGVKLNFHLNEAGDVVYGFVEPGYLEYLRVMNRWFSEGLLDPDFATVNRDIINSRWATGDMGASFDLAGGGLGGILPAMLASDDPDHATFDLVAIPNPVLNRGDMPTHGHMVPGFQGVGSAAITTSAGNIEAAARLLDFGYSEEGHIFFNFGIEGETFEWVNGIPTYTDRVMNNVNGWPLAQYMQSVTRANFEGPFMQSQHFPPQFQALPQQRDALFVWTQSDSERFMLPPVTPTVDEADRIAMILTDISSYVDEMRLRFIMGEESLDNWDNYVSTVFSMGLQEVLDVQNAALQRFNNR
ncbi:MAG: ABC transporter substrate-binding protein [Defluviitaleaceae bacterium]|nr:ABC transporter substrate-binding protein [Defluviitaleaceae bacterium]